MKRFWAAVIDFIICQVLGIVFFCFILFVLGVGLEKSNERVINILYQVSFLGVCFIYSLFFDYLFRGKTPGKKMAGCGVFCSGERKDTGFIIKHALFRTVASLLYIIAAPYYLATRCMFYDNILGVGEEKAGSVEEQGTAKMEKGKRLEAMIIDYFVMVLVFTCTGLFFIMCFLQFHVENRMIFLGTFIVCYTFIFGFLFFLLTDFITRGGGIGKKKAGIRLLSAGKEFDTAMVWKHSVLKLAACCIWPVSLIYFLKTGRMFYDRWLKLEVVIEEGRKAAGET